jgi:AcrR family transcriptional regulator
MLGMWDRAAAADSEPRIALSPDRIAVAALAIADADGLEGLTMRRLAAQLGVVPMSVYRHVAGKEGLLELIVDAAFGEVSFRADPRWEGTLRSLAVELRALVMRHPWLTSTAARSAHRLTPHRLELAEAALGALPGIDPDRAMGIVRAIESYAMGASAAEVAFHDMMDDGTWLESGPGGGLDRLLGTGRYPRFAAYVKTAHHVLDPEWQFFAGLDQLLAGIGTDLGSDQAASGPPM